MEGLVRDGGTECNSGSRQRKKKMENIERREELQRAEGEPGGKGLVCRSGGEKGCSHADGKSVGRRAGGPGAGTASWLRQREKLP